MPRYYLNVEYERSFNEDVEGEEFESCSAALAEAQKVARELLIESIRSDSASVPQRVYVLDATSREVGRFLVRDLVPRAFF